MILGAHPAVFYGGELRKSTFLGDEDKPLKKRVCKLCGAACPVWGGLRAPLVPDVYEVLARRTGVHVVVDSSKGAEWQREQITALAGTGSRLHPGVLDRHGRAVPQVSIGPAAETITAEAARLGAGLTVIGPRGLGAAAGEALHRKLRGGPGKGHRLEPAPDQPGDAARGAGHDRARRLFGDREDRGAREPLLRTEGLDRGPAQLGEAGGCARPQGTVSGLGEASGRGRAEGLRDQPAGGRGPL